MQLKELRVSGYRSLREIRLGLGPLTVVTGPNGSGKSNLYQALHLLSRAATGGLARTIAEEGGMGSVLWAGPRRKAAKNEPVRLSLAAITDTFSYELRCGLPTPRITLFSQDPEVKEEYVWHGRARRPATTYFQRDLSGAWIRDAKGGRTGFTGELAANEAVLSQLREPHLYPEIALLRAEMERWRFYHHFRSDPASPLRQPRPGFRTPILGHDGSDLAAALQTILESENAPDLEATVAAAFDGARLRVTAEGARFRLLMEAPGLRRPLEATELSDGTLRFLCLAAALLSSRPGGLLALNEPETSLHPEVLDSLAKLIVNARRQSQVWVTTHSEPLAQAIERFAGIKRISLERIEGATQVVGQGLVFQPED